MFSDDRGGKRDCGFYRNRNDVVSLYCSVALPGNVRKTKLLVSMEKSTTLIYCSLSDEHCSDKRQRILETTTDHTDDNNRLLLGPSNVRANV